MHILVYLRLFVLIYVGGEYLPERSMSIICFKYRVQGSASSRWVPKRQPTALTTVVPPKLMASQHQTHRLASNMWWSIWWLVMDIWWLSKLMLNSGWLMTFGWSVVGTCWYPGFFERAYYHPSLTSLHQELQHDKLVHHQSTIVNYHLYNPLSIIPKTTTRPS